MAADTAFRADSKVGRDDYLMTVTSFKEALPKLREAVKQYDRTFLDELLKEASSLIEAGTGENPGNTKYQDLIMELLLYTSAIIKTAGITISDQMNKGEKNSHTSSRPPSTDGYGRGKDPLKEDKSSGKEQSTSQTEEKPLQAGEETGEHSEAQKAGPDREAEDAALKNDHKSLRGLFDEDEGKKKSDEPYQKGCSYAGEEKQDPVKLYHEKCRKCSLFEECKKNSRVFLTRNVLDVKVEFIITPFQAMGMVCPNGGRPEEQAEKESAEESRPEQPSGEGGGKAAAPEADGAPAGNAAAAEQDAGTDEGGESSKGKVLMCGSFPEDITSSSNFGALTKALTLTLFCYGFVSMDKTRKIMSALLKRPCAKGDILNFARDIRPEMEKVNGYIKNALWLKKLVHLDETGFHVLGDLAWIHSACDAFFTYVSIQAQRGYEGMSAAGFIDFYEGIWDTDCWTPYMGRDPEKHALCCAHLLRELLAVALFFSKDTEWASSLMIRLIEMNRLRNEYKEKGMTEFPEEVKKEFYEDVNSLIGMGMKLNPVPEKENGKRGKTARGKVRCLLDRIHDNLTSFCLFVEDFDVPFTNTTAERSFRSMSEKESVSGTFRSWEGAVLFMLIWSYIDSCVKHGITVLDAFQAAFEGRAVGILFGDNPPECPESVQKAMNEAAERPQEEGKKPGRKKKEAVLRRIEAAAEANRPVTETSESEETLDGVLIDRILDYAKKHGITAVETENGSYTAKELKERREKEISDRRRKRALHKEEAERKQKEKDARKEEDIGRRTREHLKGYKEKIAREAKRKQHKRADKIENILATAVSAL